MRRAIEPFKQALSPHRAANPSSHSPWPPRPRCSEERPSELRFKKLFRPRLHIGLNNMKTVTKGDLTKIHEMEMFQQQARNLSLYNCHKSNPRGAATAQYRITIDFPNGIASWLLLPCPVCCLKIMLAKHSGKHVRKTTVRRNA